MGLLVKKHCFCEQQSKTTHRSLILWRFPRHFDQRYYYYFPLVVGGASYVALISSNRCMVLHSFIANMYPAIKAIF